MKDLKGRKLGRQRFSDTIGEGGRAEIYRAHDEGLDYDVVVEMPPASVAQDPECTTRVKSALIRLRLWLRRDYFVRPDGSNRKKPSLAARRDQGKKMWSVEAGAPSDGELYVCRWCGHSR